MKAENATGLILASGAINGITRIFFEHFSLNAQLFSKTRQLKVSGLIKVCKSGLDQTTKKKTTKSPTIQVKNRGSKNTVRLIRTNIFRGKLFCNYWECSFD